ncbi:hypothetical protein GFB56_30205 [Ensifer sp. T173]|uniref:Uncharacterized protein n=1 Tax=Ensifer canadensis TaxID=555315 RepID=A0AAW4FUJ9_9HYPH|nr:hypothetical protein [Ensifer canadensis]MBM3095011.1 hypothetical protein [Ensifer canadensis]UBI81004.1 hypothetical protein J3R84_37880 [Ensifer canadensis]
MADSDNSRTLPPVTRGDFHSSVAASLPTYPELAASLTAPLDVCSDDLALTIWREWCAARQNVIESCLRQQGLETKLFSMVGSPLDAPEALQAADKQVGYSEALEEERHASTVEEGVAETLWDTPAESIIGATAKLHAVVTKWHPSLISDEYPWPQIRSVIADLLKIDVKHPSVETQLVR